MKNKNLLEAIAILVGTVVGAGVLGLPYIVAKSGFWTGILVISFMGIVCTLLYLYLGEVVLRTNGFHQLTGYAERYLGKTGKWIMASSMFVGIYGALTAYILGEGKSISALFGLKDVAVNLIGISVSSEFVFSFAFFLIVSMIVYLGLETVGESEMFVLPVYIGVIILVCLFSIQYINPSNFTSLDLSNVLMPYGVILFAFLGATAIPEMNEELVKNRRLMKKAILMGMSIPFVLYIIFTFAVVGVTGASTTEVATIGLGLTMGKTMLALGNIFAIFAMATSFLALGLALKEMYMFDLKLNEKVSWFLTCFPPLFIVILGVTSFTKVISLGGTIAGGIDGVLIALMAYKAKTLGDRKPEYSIPINIPIVILLSLIFIIGAGYYFWILI
jgi:tyrosine-specific transport protein